MRHQDSIRVIQLRLTPRHIRPLGILVFATLPIMSGACCIY
jgi:hypothetical protein